MVRKEKHSFAVTALVLGICSCAFTFFGLATASIANIIGIIVGIIGIVMAVIAKNAGNTEGSRKAGFVLSIIGLILNALGLITSIVFIGLLTL